MENLYTDEELDFFKSLEDDIDKGTYKPMPKDQLKKEMEFYQQVAANTIKEKGLSEDLYYKQAAKKALADGFVDDNEAEVLINSIK